MRQGLKENQIQQQLLPGLTIDFQHTIANEERCERLHAGQALNSDFRQWARQLGR